MASVSGTSGYSANSIYGTRNVISGLASGMDTESMIENAISGYKTKISSLNQQRTKLSWQQEAYRDIITKMASFSSKYTSYTSSTNLMSSTFFNQAVRTAANGANASKVAASGRGTSDVAINGVRQLATAATYKLSGSALLGNAKADGSAPDKASAAASKGFDLDKMTVSNFYGTMSLTYGKDQTLSFTFSEGDVFKDVNELAENMRKQLEGQTISLTNGGGKKASEMLDIEVDETTNTISFKDKNDNSVYISDVSSGLKSAFSADTGEGSKSFKVGELTKTVNSVDYLQANPLSITLDGVTKTIEMPSNGDIIEQLKAQAKESGDSDKAQAINDLVAKLEKNQDLPDEKKEALTDAEKDLRAQAYVGALQGKIDKAFGTLEGGGKKLKVSNIATENGNLQLSFEAGRPGSSFAVTSSVGKSMGFGGTHLTSYLDTGKTLKDLLGEEGLKGLETRDKNGKPVTDKNGNTLYALTINGKKIGDFTEKTELSTILSRINSNKDAGVNVSYSKLTNEFTFTAKETGAAGNIDFSAEGYGMKKDEKGEMKDTLGAKLFGITSKDGEGQVSGNGPVQTAKGQDAIFTATIDGGEPMELTRSSNIVDFDGLSVTLKGTFGYDSVQAKDKNGNLIFNSGDRQIYAKKAGDGRFEILRENGSAYTYSNGSNTSLEMFKNAKVYGRLDDNGQMTFEMSAQIDGETVTKQLYAQPSDDGKNTWFSVYQGKAQTFTAKMDSGKLNTDTEAVTFTTSSDADKIVDTIKDFVNDYNEMVTEIKNAYSTLPMQRSNGAYYEPLTEEEKEGMSDSAIESWEENAKTGLLFGDRDLSSLYSRLTSAVSMYGQDLSDLKAAGITVNYSSGLSTLSFNEKTLRDTLESDPDRVRDLFTRSKDNGAATDGLMAALKDPLEKFGGTTGAVKGTLVEKAGSPLSPTSIYSNQIQKQLDNLDTQIEKWQDKMSDQVDYYTSQFTRLEQLIAQMNSQSSTLAGLMGGY